MSAWTRWLAAPLPRSAALAPEHGRRAINRSEDLEHIRRALERAGSIARSFTPGRARVTYKNNGGPVTEADLAVDDALRRELPRPDEGWLSEETPDTRARLDRRRVWIVDPIDGTREFMDSIPEWNISIGLAEDGVAVAGGVYNPSTDEMFLGAPGTGITLNGQPVTASPRPSLEGGVVLVGRWALEGWRGRRWQGHPFQARAVGAIAYALALVAAGSADAIWSRSPKAEWDIAAGVALITAAGGHITAWDGSPFRFNRWPPITEGLVATGSRLMPAVRALLAIRGQVPTDG
jgi:myo-inositol-1(or 4)-monophosphatase